MKKVFCTILIIQFIFCFDSAWSEPGNERILEIEEMKVILYPRKIWLDSNKAVYAELILIPERLASECKGKTFLHCEKVSHCHSFPTAHKCDSATLNCEEIVSESCAFLGMTLEEVRNNEHLKVGKPTHILNTTINLAEYPKIREKLASLIPNKNESIISAPAEEHAIQTKVRWELWTNGENFKILPSGN